MSFFRYPSGTTDSGEATLAFLDGASEADWQAITAHAELQRFASGDMLLAAGSRDDAFCILVEGTVEVFVRHRPFPDRVLDRLNAGTVFGEISFFDGGARSASIRALSTGSLLRVTRRSFDVLAAWEPQLGRRILTDLGRILATRLRRMTRMIGG